jgi:hypothetical protein
MRTGMEPEENLPGGPAFLCADLRDLREIKMQVPADFADERGLNSMTPLPGRTSKIPSG